jgi:hydroxypyruvate reductase
MNASTIANQADQRTILLSMYEQAVATAQPSRCLPAHFPPAPEKGRLIVLAGGKAAGAMAEAAARHYIDVIASGQFTGLSTPRKGYGKAARGFELIEAAHPVPDGKSTDAANRALALAGEAGEDDLVLVLLSGGASALWAAPVNGVSLEEKQALTRALLKAGAPISGINCVRKHLSRIKGGRLASAAAPADVITLAISDVPGDEPDTIGSGPTVPDRTSLADARAVLDRFGIKAAPSIVNALNSPENETPKPGDPAFAGARYTLAARPLASLEAAAEIAEAAGYRPIMLGDALEGEARDIAREHAALALRTRESGQRAAILSGGELTVTIRGEGRGGPNQEYALALALALNGTEGIFALAADTDGTDGGSGAPDDPAGALVTPDTLARARESGVDAERFLAKNDSTGFFEMVDDLIVSGPTYTNVNDLRVILVEPQAASTPE